MAASSSFRQLVLSAVWLLFIARPACPVNGLQLMDDTVGGANSSSGSGLHQAILFPSQGDLLIGRVSHLTASSTCGEVAKSQYCPSGQMCRFCESQFDWDSEQHPESHKIGNVVAKIRNSNATYNTWWMSEPGVENVTIHLDMGNKFTFTHLIMIFHNYRPKAWWLERSSDYGQTYQPYGYFAEKCDEVFPWVKTGPRMNLNDVVCSSSYTEMTPSDKGQVVFNAIPQHLSESDLFDAESRRMRAAQTDFTNLQIHFVKYHTLSDEKLSTDSSELKKYYFGLYEMNVHGMCICNGHAAVCRPAPGEKVEDRNKVHGYCECLHNTQGPNCEECLEFYQDRRWAPATPTASNECRRCECNGHSAKCAFSQKKWDESGGVSGGVCLDCLHSTAGDNCERCVQGTYRDETKPLASPDICLACECSSAGIKEKFCEPETDKAKGLIAGHCHCKENVAGRKCDRCKPGYWDLRPANPQGCQVCDCLLLGTTGNQGCDQFTGQCPCKVNVEGEKCNRCKSGFYNLSQSDTGCSACECDIGGSLGPTCNPVSGSCTCKPGFGGRRCDAVLDRHFVPHFNIDGSVVDVTESPDTGRFPRVTRPEEPTLTGRSGLRLKSLNQRTPDTLVIPLRNRTIGLPAGEYDIALKVYPRSVNSSMELPVQLEAGMDYVNCTTRPPFLDGHLLVPSTAEFRADREQLGGAWRPYLVRPIYTKVCVDARGLEKISVMLIGVPQRDDIFIDAVIIGKSLHDPIGHLLNKSESTGRSPQPPFTIDVKVSLVTSLYNCLDYWKPEAQQPALMPEECRRLVQSLSGRGLPGAKQCSCDGYGSRGPICDKIGGQCPCWPNVIGRTCDACAARHYGFGRFPAEGCRPCDCSPEGSATTDHCDQDTGDCQCLQASIGGKKCDSCKPGYWIFPLCVACQCNGLAVDCDKRTGACLDCRDNTGGAQCEECKTGFYGAPRRNVTCRPCPCPGGQSGSVQHAATCQLKSDSPPTAKCNCQPGYLGDSCDRCDANHYGNPATGNCTRCSCNGNIDFSVPNSCDPDTGRCTRCLNQTAGASCEECRPGFHGQAAVGHCWPCQCSAYGTVPAAQLPNPISHGNGVIEHTCDSKSGNCDCLPNVEGPACDRCKPLHYNLTSWAGCSACDCDPIGSSSQQCVVTTGQCPCKPGRGGRRCDQCQDLYFGDPTKPGLEGCQPCDCHPKGSQTNWCDKTTGRCVCKAAITGRQCDQCERGTTGLLPNCTTCGECWYTWDKTISGLAATANRLRATANSIQLLGDLPGDLGTSVAELEASVEQINRAINGTGATSHVAVELQEKLKRLLEDFSPTKNVSHRILALREALASIKTVSMKEMNAKVDRMNQKHLHLKRKTAELKDRLVDPNLLPPADTLRQLGQGEARYNASALQLLSGNVTLALHEQLTGSNQAIYANVTARADELKAASRNRSEAATAILGAVEKRLPELNKLMCVGYDGDQSMYSRAGNYCSSSCGGPADDICGTGAAAAVRVACAESAVCADSAVAKARALNDSLRKLEDRMKKEADTAGNTTGELVTSTNTVSNLNGTVADTDGRVLRLKAEYDSLNASTEQLQANIDGYLQSNRTTRADIEAIASSIQRSTEDFGDTDLPGLTQRVQTLLTKVRAEHNVSRVEEDTRAARQTVRQLVSNASRVADGVQKAKSEADRLVRTLAGAEQNQLAGENSLTRGKAAMDELDGKVAEMSETLVDYQAALAAAKAKEQGVKEKGRRIDVLASELERKRSELDQERNGTRSTHLATQEILDMAINRAASSGISDAGELARRLQAINQLRQRLGLLRVKLGGDRGQLAKLDLAVADLETSMEVGAQRLAALLGKLSQSDSTEGSLSYMLTAIDFNNCQFNVFK